MRAALLAFALCSASLSPAVASTDAPTPDDAAAVREGHSVVVGAFDGSQRPELRVYDDQLDDQGRPTTHREVVTRHGFVVSEVLDGAAVTGTITVNAVGGTLAGITTPASFQPPPPGQRVVLALSPDRRGGYVAVHAKRFDASSDAELASVRAWVAAARAPADVPPGLIEERLRALGAGTEPASAPAAAAGDRPDIPDGWVPDEAEAPDGTGADVPSDPGGALHPRRTAPSIPGGAFRASRAGAPTAPPPAGGSGSPWRAAGAVGLAVALVAGWLRWRRR